MDDSRTTRIAAAPGRRVRHENGNLLAEGGEPVIWSPWWGRRLTDFDIVLVEDEADADAKKKGK